MFSLLPFQRGRGWRGKGHRTLAAYAEWLTPLVDRVPERFYSLFKNCLREFAGAAEYEGSEVLVRRNLDHIGQLFGRVVYTWRGDRVRILSARTATPREPQQDWGSI